MQETISIVPFHISKKIVHAKNWHGGVRGAGGGGGAENEYFEQNEQFHVIK